MNLSDILDNIQEASAGTGTGVGSSGAVAPPSSGPSELEYDLTKMKDEFRGKNTRADIKKSKGKRKTLKQYLQRRTDREVDRITAEI